MSNEQLTRLWAEREKHTTNSDWVRVAKEVRYRNRFKPGAISEQSGKDRSQAGGRRNQKV